MRSHDDIYWEYGAEEATLKRWLKIIAGFAMMLAGVAGWMLPVIPGWALFIPGLILLSKEFRWARRLLAWLRSHFTKQTAREIPGPPTE